MPLPLDLGLVAAMDHAFNHVMDKGCGHGWVKPNVCIDCTAHHLLWTMGPIPQGW